MIRLFVAISCALLLSPIASYAQNWQTFYHEFTGKVGGENVSGWLMNRFGVLQGAYYYDKYKAEREKLDPRDDRLTIYLEGSQMGNAIKLNEMCWYCQSVDDPELFNGTLAPAGIAGKWHKTDSPDRELTFNIRFTTNTLTSDLPPNDLNDLAQYEGKDIWRSGFFSSEKIQRELKATLGNDLEAWKEFVSQPLARGVFHEHGKLLLLELWHEDMYSFLTFIALDPARKRIYVAWRGSPKSDRNDVMFYGDDRPEEFAMAVLRDLTESWGHVYDFTYAGKRVIATRKKK